MTERVRVSSNGRLIAEADAGSGGRVVVDGRSFRVRPTGDGRYVVTGDDGAAVVVAAAGPPHALWVTARGQAALVGVERGAQRRRSGAAAVSGDMSAPMPAAVVTVLVAPGDRVTVGTPLVVLEAMKMELPVRASRDGVIRAVACSVGQLVTPGVPLVEIDP